MRARDILGELVDHALYDGNATVITRRGRAAAAIIPIALFRVIDAGAKARRAAAAA